MTLQETLTKFQNHIDAGHLDPNMPAFLLIAQDVLAANNVRDWAYIAKGNGVPPQLYDDAMATAEAFDNWPTKQVPGRPETRKTLT